MAFEKDNNIMRTRGEIIANEVWNMLPNSCKDDLVNVKKQFLASIRADVDDVIQEVVIKAYNDGQELYPENAYQYYQDNF